MELKKVLSEHQKYAPPGTLMDNLGDGYLLAHNSIYLNIRKSVKKAGFKLSSRRFYDYEVLSLTQLPKILKSKTIPYVNNVNALREIEKAAPGVFGLDEVPPLKANYLMHESAHAVARSLKPRGIPKATHDLILSTFLEEAFANTCECLANLDSTTDIHDEFLYKNSYIMEKPRDRASLRAAEAQIGKKALFRLLLLAYLHSNFLKTRLDSVDFTRVYRCAGIQPSQDSAALKRVFQIGLNLDPGFTIFTNSFCLRLMGIKGSIYEFLEFDFLGMITKNVRYQKWIQDLERVIFL